MKNEIRKTLEDYCSRKEGAVYDTPFSDDIDDGVFRHENNRKWFALFMLVSKKSLGFGNEGHADLLNLKLSPNEIDGLIDGHYFFPAYHMNHRLWISVYLIEGLDIRKVKKLVDRSYLLTEKKRKKRKHPEDDIPTIEYL